MNPVLTTPPAPLRIQEQTLDFLALLGADNRVLAEVYPQDGAEGSSTQTALARQLAAAPVLVHACQAALQYLAWQGEASELQELLRTALALLCASQLPEPYELPGAEGRRWVQPGLVTEEALVASPANASDGQGPRTRKSRRRKE